MWPPSSLALSVALSVALTAALPPPRPATPALHPIIANGSSVAVPYMGEAFLFCWVAEPTRQVQWRDPSHAPLPAWSPTASRYHLGSGKHLPHAYLLFRDFRQEHEGVYTCVARGGAGLEGSASVTLTLQRPSVPRP
ncbi:hypothetical protein GWK47_029799 [Chionoecetes opilio]|uniref:Ig-like domain-containing protein n=1 Tax=Chionoecetes opilio TaxID=41210 RepID=A0A8J5D1V9_CHIOP|nr:hypothetical protein GWK47_029799 [Chionoecetes opilio]